MKIKCMNIFQQRNFHTCFVYDMGGECTKLKLYGIITYKIFSTQNKTKLQYYLRYGERTKLKLYEIITYEIFST